MDSNVPLVLTTNKGESEPVKQKLDEVNHSQKVDQAEHGDNVIIEELSSPDVDLEPDDMFDEELQPAEG